MKSFNKFLDEAGQCWSGYKPVPGKKPYTPGSCVKEDVHDDIKRIRQGKPLKKEETELDKSVSTEEELANKYKISVSEMQDLIAQGTKVEMEHTNEKSAARKIALKHLGEKVDYYKKLKKYVEEVEELDEDGAWTRKEGQSESGGLNRKGIESYRRENPGSKLSMAVTTKPSKLKPGSKAANRRKSFCARMGGMKKRLPSAKTANDPDSRINKSLRKWNC
jgi:hypothetical protein